MTEPSITPSITEEVIKVNICKTINVLLPALCSDIKSVCEWFYFCCSGKPLFRTQEISVAHRKWCDVKNQVVSVSSYSATYRNLSERTMAVSAHFGTNWNISATTGGIVMKCGSDLHVLQRMNCDDFGDPLTFHLAPSSGRHVNVSNTFMTKYHSHQPQLHFVFSAKQEILALLTCWINSDKHGKHHQSVSIVIVSMLACWC